jgi:hypothetical protein
VKGDSLLRQNVTFRLDDGAHGELARRAELAGVSANTFARNLVLEGLRDGAGFPPELRDRVEALCGFVAEAAGPLEAVAVLPEKVDAVHAWTVGSRRSLEAADYRKVLRRLYPWVVRAIVYLDGLTSLSLPDNAEYQRFQQKVEKTTRDLLDEVLEALDAER